MNKNRINVIIIALLFLSCQGKGQEKIHLTSQNDSTNVILKLSKNKKYITRIQFPKILIIKNLSNQEVNYVNIKYHYNNLMKKGRDLGISLFDNTDISNEIPVTGKRIIPKEKSIVYKYYTRHFIDTLSIYQNQLKQYIPNLNQKNNEMKIDNIEKFQTDHPNLFNKLVQKDSISVQLLDGKKLGQRITVPVEW